MKIEQAAKQLEALGNPRGSRSIEHSFERAPAGFRSAGLQEKLRIAASTLSHHLHRLILTGLVTQERQATTLICRANYPAMTGLIGFLVDECCADAACATTEGEAPPDASLFCQQLLYSWKDRIWRQQTLDDLPVAVIGAGPVGLAAAAHLIAQGLPVKVYEAGPAVGANLREWGHVRVFTPWRYCVDAAATALLKRQGWRPPPPRGLPDRRRACRRLS